VDLQHENKLGKREGRLEMVVNREESVRKWLREATREGLKERKTELEGKRKGKLERKFSKIRAVRERKT
jgi:hypothetical protein